MKQLPFLHLATSDEVATTHLLTPFELGCVWKLRYQLWETNTISLKDNDNYLSRICNTTPKKFRSSRPNFDYLFGKENGNIFHIADRKKWHKALKLSKLYDGVMLGRLIHNNPFCLKDVDRQFYNQTNNYIVSEKTINDYFNFIRPKFGKDSIYRLLSPLLNIFFGVHNAKEFKIDIHSRMKENNFEILEKIFINFIKEKKILLN